MAEWRNGDEPEPPVAPPPVEAAIPVVDKVADFLTEELHHGRRYTANTLEQSGKTGLSRARLRAALAALEVSGRVTPRDYPPELRQGGRKAYLHPLNFARPRGEVAANTPQTDREQTPTSPPPNLAAAYREKNGGEVDAAISSSNSTTSPANIGEVPAKWRSKGKPLDSSLKSPKSGSGGDDSAENDGMSDSDQRRYSAEPRGEVGEVPDDAQPAEHGPDIQPDISSATQAESKGESSALASKVPDIARANQQPPAADPLATRVAELIAQGWAPPNAQARARSEAMHRAKPGARS